MPFKPWGTILSRTTFLPLEIETKYELRFNTFLLLRFHSHTLCALKKKKLKVFAKFKCYLFSTRQTDYLSQTEVKRSLSKCLNVSYYLCAYECEGCMRDETKAGHELSCPLCQRS